MCESESRSFDEARHAACLLLHDGEEARAGGGVLAGRTLERLDEAEEGCERRPQLVARIGDEVRTHLLGALLERQIVECYDEGDLVAGEAGKPLDASDEGAADRGRELEGGARAGPAPECRLRGIEEGRDAERGGKLAPLGISLEKLLGRRIGAHDAQTPVEHEERVGQAVEHGLEGCEPGRRLLAPRLRVPLHPADRRGQRHHERGPERARRRRLLALGKRVEMFGEPCHAAEVRPDDGADRQADREEGEEGPAPVEAAKCYERGEHRGRGQCQQGRHREDRLERGGSLGHGSSNFGQSGARDKVGRASAAAKGGRGGREAARALLQAPPGLSRR